MIRWGWAMLWLLTVGQLQAAEVAWKMHTINAQSEFPACAAFDVDHDGDLDIYSGGFWYEAPSWKQHKVRDVEIIRGRYDDYSNQPMDCNGDGWTDIISINYRSETIYWIEHPGKNLGKQDWLAHVIDKPGPSETGRLYDLDGDGDLDILPNGTKFAAWYEFAPAKKDDGTLEPKWVKHELPMELAGHGLGVKVGTPPLLVASHGLVGPANKKELTGRWLWKPFSDAELLTPLHSDASVPVLPYSVNNDPFRADATNDQWIWGRGHRTGLYWGRLSDPTHDRPRVTLQAIDTSWSQCHAPLLADIDSDGQTDLVAGKRYMGHEGKDPGEYDPLIIYWYQLDPQRRAWQRHVMHEGGPAGIDLDGKALDIDGDGDIDVLAPSRNGLYLFENLLVNKTAVEPTAAMRKANAAYVDHSRLFAFATESGDLRPVKTPSDWARRRWHILGAMEAVMGPFPNPVQRIPLNIEVLGIDKITDGDYSGMLLSVQTEPDQILKVRLLVPNRRKGRLPAMLCLHPTSLEHGKKIVTGEVDKANRAYAHELAERGYVCICPDYPTMGENPFDLRTTHKHFESGTMKAIWDNVRCLDVLESLPYVDPDRIGVIGHSLGGHNGMFTACFDQRIKCVVTSCGFTPFHDYYGGKLDGWAQDRYMPKIRTVYNHDPNKMPFDFYEVLGAIAPRPIFINAPLHDDNFDVNGVKKAVLESQKVYDLLGKQQGIEVRYPDCQHDFPDAIRREAYEWLDKQLK